MARVCYALTCVVTKNASISFTLPALKCWRLRRFYSVGSDRVRVSVDDVSGSVIECIVKEKIAHSDWWNGRPGCVDFRISANREKKGEQWW